jgi:hypothetical protein
MCSNTIYYEEKMFCEKITGSFGMSSTSTNGIEIHHTVLCGYSYKSDGSSWSITIMNPGMGDASGEKQTATYGSAGRFTFIYGGDVYIWNQTLKTVYTKGAL